MILVIVKIFDPLAFILVFIISLILRSKWAIPVAAIIGAVIIESIISSSPGRSWGAGIIPGFIACGIQALISYWVINKFKKKKSQKESLVCKKEEDI